LDVLRVFSIQLAFRVLLFEKSENQEGIFMEETARAVMQTDFETLSPHTSIRDAVKVFQQASLRLKRRVFGMMVTDENEKLVGMLSMYDVFIFLRPKHIEIWGEMDDIDLEGLLDDSLSRAGAIQVGDLMTTELITITQDTNLMVIVDIMIKKHMRRLPVLEESKILGIVFISDLFDYLLQKFMD
jgi:CBS domain-containing protein